MNYNDEITEDSYRRLRDYLMAGNRQLRGRHGFRIPALVLDQWHEQGYAVLQTNTLARTYGVGRKTMWNTIKGVIDCGFIREVGRTDDGKAKYVPCLERGAEWRASVQELAANGR